MEKLNIVYLQSGGPTAMINTSFYGLLKAALADERVGNIFGSRYGVQGLLEDNLVDLRKEDPEEIELLKQTPGAMLGSARRLLKDEQDYIDVEKTLKKHNINLVFVNGGNDSMDTCAKLSNKFGPKGIRVIGIPKTVDNDLMGMDHVVGYPSAAKHIINELSGIAQDLQAYKTGKVMIVDVMGRDTGWLPVAGALMKEDLVPDLIYTPEMGFDLDVFLKQIKEIYEKKHRVLALMPEHVPGLSDSFGKDAFGHVVGEGLVHVLAKIVEEKLGLSSRGIGMGIAVRSNSLILSKLDQEEAIAISEFALKKAIEGESGKVVCLNRVSSVPYKFELTLEDGNKIANAIRYIPDSWILGPGQIDKKAVKEYLLPLLSGEPELKYENGIIRYSNFKFVKA